MFRFFFKYNSTSEKWFHFKIQFLFGHLFHFVFNIWAFISFHFQYLGIYFISFSIFGHLFHFIFNILAFISFHFQYLGIYFISFSIFGHLFHFVFNIWAFISFRFQIFWHLFHFVFNNRNFKIIWKFFGKWDNLSSSILWFKNIDWISFLISRTRSEDVWRRWVRSTTEYTETEGKRGEGVRCELGYSTPGSQVSGEKLQVFYH